jgi:2',3'-cyclic-nucleotide 2'-phosphodiesterase (5'-nucleotidase family)
MSIRTRLSLLLASAMLLAGLAPFACNTPPKQPAPPPKVPSLRLYVASSIAGALEPCGCRKDMLGGVDHAAQLIRQGEVEAPHSLVLGAGPMLFMNPAPDATHAHQDLWKAATIAQSFGSLKLLAWAPGANDFAQGAEKLTELVGASGAQLLAGNLTVPGVDLAARRSIEVNGIKVGIAGVAVAERPADWALAPVQTDPEVALREALKAFESEAVPLRIALVAGSRGVALRLAESVPGFQVMVVGKSLDRGEANDAPTPPVQIGKTLVVQGPNHLQALAVVDLYLRDGSFDLADASGATQQEQRVSLERRAEELAARLATWRASGNVSAKDLDARKAELQTMQAQLAALRSPVAPTHGSFFRYQLREVREAVGVDPAVAAELAQYYKKVNDHNKVAFADRKPPEPSPGTASYVGVERCASCHKEETAFWQTTRHAHAYATLSDQFKEFNLDCVSCHVTGYEKPGGSTVTHVEGLMNVQCENCHGAGSIHAKTSLKKDIVRTPSFDQCKSCHHAPHVADDWDVGLAWPKVLGPGHGPS